MTNLRWLLFLPIAAVLIAIAQLITGLLGGTPWWIGVPIVLFFGIILAASSMLPARIAPDHKIGGLTILGLFLLFEVICLCRGAHDASWTQLVVRILTDLYIVVGCIYVAMQDE